MPNPTFKFVLSSQIRMKILGFLSREPHTPTELASKTEKHLSHVSRALRELEDRQLVSCPNAEYCRERRYALTPRGNQMVVEIMRYEMRMSLR